MDPLARRVEGESVAHVLDHKRVLDRAEVGPGELGELGVERLGVEAGGEAARVVGLERGARGFALLRGEGVGLAALEHAAVTLG